MTQHILHNNIVQPVHRCYQLKVLYLKNVSLLFSSFCFFIRGEKRKEMEAERKKPKYERKRGKIKKKES